MSSAAESRSRAFLAAVLALVAAAHAAALAGDFVWDDRVLVLENPAVAELRAPLAYLEHAFWAGTPQDAGAQYYRPLAVLSLALDQQLWGGRAFGFRLTNLLAHLGCVALVFAAARRAGAAPGLAALAALGFGALPRGTEAVDWISGRTDVLAAGGALGALLIHDLAGSRRTPRLAAAAILLAGLLAKESAIAGAVAIGALELARARERRERLAPTRLAPACAALAIAALLRFAAGALPAAAADGLAPRALRALDALGAYALVLLDPLRPSVAQPLLGAPDPLRVALGAVALAALCAALGLAWRRATPLVFAACALALAALAPALHLLPFPVRYLSADRCLYLPLAAAAVAASGALAPWLAAQPDRARPLAWIAAGIAAILLPVTALRAALWTDETALWAATLERADPRDALPHAMLGEALLRQGQPGAALARLEHALALDRAWSETHPEASLAEGILGNLAGARLGLGRTALALAALDELVARHPDQPKHRYNRGVVYARLGRHDEAARELDRALALAPGWPQATRARAELTAATSTPRR